MHTHTDIRRCHKRFEDRFELIHHHLRIKIDHAFDHASSDVRRELDHFGACAENEVAALRLPFLQCRVPVLNKRVELLIMRLDGFLNPLLDSLCNPLCEPLFVAFRVTDLGRITKQPFAFILRLLENLRRLVLSGFDDRLTAPMEIVKIQRHRIARVRLQICSFDDAHSTAFL